MKATNYYYSFSHVPSLVYVISLNRSKKKEYYIFEEIKFKKKLKRSKNFPLPLKPNNLYYV